MKLINYCQALLVSLAMSWSVSVFAQGATFTVVPSGQGGALPANGSVVFTFSEPMDTLATTVDFFTLTNPFQPLPVTQSWNAGMTILTYTKSGGWPAGMLIWNLDGTPLDPSQDLISDGGFFTVTSGGGTGTGTNAVTSFLLGKVYFYAQTNTAASVLDPAFDIPYMFMAMTSLASNRTATGISLTGPLQGPKTLSPLVFSPEDWQFSEFTASLETLYPQGSYTFTLTPASGSGAVTLNFNVTPQPNAPHIANFTALQSADPSQPITISWDAFQGGTAADFIHVSVGTNFSTAEFTDAAALRGNQTSVVVPAGKLAANTQYDLSVGFYRAAFVTNTTEVRAVYRASITDSTLSTGNSGIPGGTIRFGNASMSGNSFGFDVECSAGQTLTIETSPSLLPGSWTKYFTTNAPGNKIRVIDPRSPGNRLYYRARNGS